MGLGILCAVAGGIIGCDSSEDKGMIIRAGSGPKLATRLLVSLKIKQVVCRRLRFLQRLLLPRQEKVRVRRLS